MEFAKNADSFRNALGWIGLRDEVDGLFLPVRYERSHMEMFHRLYHYATGLVGECGLMDLQRRSQ